jgi:hypothetical protein
MIASITVTLSSNKLSTLLRVIMMLLILFYAAVKLYVLVHVVVIMPTQEIALCLPVLSWLAFFEQLQLPKSTVSSF